MADLRLIAALVLALPAAAAPLPEPPPGWTRTESSSPGVVVSYAGPQGASFFVKVSPGLPLKYPVQLKGWLESAVAGIRDATALDYRPGRVETRRLKSGLELTGLKARLGGADKLYLGAFEWKGEPCLGVLTSAELAGDVDALFGGFAAAASARSSGVERSADGQLELSLGGGLKARDLGEAERAKGYVLAVTGDGGAELLFQRLPDEDARPDDQAAIARAVAAGGAGVPKERASHSAHAASAAGPVAVYSAAELADGAVFAAGYLPWCFWGYQLVARGPGADDLLTGVLAALKAGPGADARLLASTPRVPVPEPDGGTDWFVLGCGAGLLFVSFVIWRLSRKKG